MGFFSRSKIVTTTQKQSSTPWAEQVPHLKYAFEEAKKIYSADGPKYFPKPSVVPFCEESKLFLAKQKERALKGSILNEKVNLSLQGLFNSSFNETFPDSSILTKTSKGDYLHANPQNTEFDKLYNEFLEVKQNPAYQEYEKYIRKTTDDRLKQAGLLFQESAKQIKKQYEETVFPQIKSQFSTKGKLSSKQYENMMALSYEKLGKELKDLAREIYVKQFDSAEQYKMQAIQNIERMHSQSHQNRVHTASLLNENYAQERIHQLNAVSQLSQQKMQLMQTKLLAAKISPLVAQQDYYDLAQLSQVGKIRENLAQTQLTDEVNRWNYKNNLPSNKLAHYIGLVSGGYGGESLNSETQPLRRDGEENFFGKIMQEAIMSAL